MPETEGKSQMPTEPLVSQFLTVGAAPCEPMMMLLKSSHLLTPQASGLPERGFTQEDLEVGRKELSYEDVRKYFRPREYEKEERGRCPVGQSSKQAGGKMVPASGMGRGPKVSVAEGHPLRKVKAD